MSGGALMTGLEPVPARRLGIVDAHHHTAGAGWRYVGQGGVYGIPWRCLRPVGIEGMVDTGRLP